MNVLTEHQNIKIIDPNVKSVERHLKSTEELLNGSEAEPLMIPRRPQWDESTTPEELNQLEYAVYLEWRRHLSLIQQNDDIVITPFEKNIEFWRQLWRVVERSDVCVQILDARNPLIYLCPDLQKYVKEINENKSNIILLNKSDFLTENQRQIWAQYFDSLGMKALFFSAKQQLELDDVSEEPEDTLQDYDWTKNSSKLLGRNQLIEIFKSFRKEDQRDAITIGLVGYPNVGKSSTINAIIQTKKVSVSATPGKTKHFQTLEVDNELTLCDCPGLVFPNVVSSKAEMIVNGILPIDELKEPIPPIAILTNRIPKYVFESIYSICLPKANDSEEEKQLTTAEELLTTYGYSRGFMTQRGIPDLCRSARYILKDFVCGKLLYCFCPPNKDQKVFHKFAENTNQTKHELREDLKRILESNQTIAKNPKDFDDSYFAKNNSCVHSKGVFGVKGYTRMSSDSVRHCGDSQTSDTSIGSKPSKKHNKEKLRRIYRHLDQ